MAKRGPLIAFGLVVLLGALLFMRPYLLRKREAVTSTPVAAALFTSGVAELKPKSEACTTGVTFEPASAYARFPVQTYAKPGPPLRIRVSTPGYRYVTHVPAGYQDGSQDIAIKPPKRETKGLFCIRNDGTYPVGLSTAGEGWTVARSATLIDGVQQTQYMPLTLHEANQHTPINRLPKTFEHAATLWSLPLGLFWIVLVLTLVGVPLGVMWALRSAVLADDTAPAASRAPVTPAPPLPFGRVFRPLGRAARRAWAALAALPTWVQITALTVFAWAYVYMWASRVRTWQNDEFQTVYLARLTKHYMPQALTDTTLYFDRGIQRLEVFLLAGPLAVLPGPDALLVGHALNTLIYATAAIPIFLVTRGLGASRGWALLAAALTVISPWAVYATSYLTEPLAYPLCAWILWSVWRAAVRPSVRADLLVCLMLFLAIVSRSGMLVLLVLPPIVFVAFELRYTPLRELPRALWRKHIVFAIAVAAGLVLVVLSLAGALFPLSRLTGFYGTNFPLALTVLEKAGERAAPIVIGAAFVPFCLGLAWLVKQVVKPLDAGRFAWAVGGLVTIALMLYSAQQSGFDERYGIYLILPVFPAFALAASGRRREVGPIAVAASGIFCAVLIWRQVWATPGSPTDYFVYPAEQFYAHVVLDRLHTYLPTSVSVNTASFIVLLAVAAACAYAVAARTARAAVVTLTLAVLVLLTQIGQTEYTLRHFVEGAGGRASANLAQRGWVDRQLYGKAKVDIFADAQGNSGLFTDIWNDVQFWNTSVTGVVATGERGLNVPLGDAFRIAHPNPTTGILEGYDPPPLQHYMLVPRVYQGTGLLSKLVAESAYLPIDLVRVTDPPRVVYTIEGPMADGFLAANTPVKMRFYGDGLNKAQSYCATFPVYAPQANDGVPKARRYEIQIGDEHVKGTVADQQQTIAKVPLPALRTQPFVTGTFTATGTVKIIDARDVTVQLGRVGVAPCTTA